MAVKKTIVICSSASFYEHVNRVAEELEQLGFKVVVPQTAHKMKSAGDYDVNKIKTWLERPEDFKFKHALATAHFNEIAKGDAILIVNDSKPGQPNYIGPNATMEWGLAYYLGKPVFIMNGVAKSSNNYEEVYGMATVIDGDLRKIKL
jgi:nucleoside 2-deoxyribosyltransferase